MLTELWWEDPWNIFNTLIATILLLKLKKKTNQNENKPYIGNDHSFSSLSTSRESILHHCYALIKCAQSKPHSNSWGTLSRTWLVISKSAKIKLIVDFSRNKTKLRYCMLWIEKLLLRSIFIYCIQATHSIQRWFKSIYLRIK